MADCGYWSKIRIHVEEFEDSPEGCEFTKKDLRKRIVALSFMFVFVRIFYCNNR